MVKCSSETRAVMHRRRVFYGSALQSKLQLHLGCWCENVTVVTGRAENVTVFARISDLQGATWRHSKMAAQYVPACPFPLDLLKTSIKPPIDLAGVDVRGPASGIVTHNENAALLWGSGGCLQGEVPATFKEMLDTFGAPTDGGAEGKISSEWFVLFADGTRAHVYDWCETDRYRADSTLPSVGEFLDVASKRQITWHVGAQLPRAAELVATAVHETRMK